MKKHTKTMGIVLTIFLVFAAAACIHKDNSQNTLPGRPLAAGTPAVNAGVIIEIKLPTGGRIIGSTSAEGVPDGVFIKDRTVTLSPFEMAETEVTYALWKEVYDWAVSDNRGANKYAFANKGKEGESGTEGAEPTAKKNHPVTSVSWRDVIVWCNAYTEMTDGRTDNCVYRSGADKTTILRDAADADGCGNAYFDKTKKGFRLPTEAEWEFAARSNSDGTLSPLNFLSGASDDYKNAAACKAVAWYDSNSSGSTHEVKKLAENAQKLYDMSGNVWEWCWDKYGIIAEEDIAGPAGAVQGANRVLRGGSWNLNVSFCLPGGRVDGFTPGTADYCLGFRLCRYK